MNIDEKEYAYLKKIGALMESIRLAALNNDARRVEITLALAIRATTRHKASQATPRKTDSSPASLVEASMHPKHVSAGRIGRILVDDGSLTGSPQHDSPAIDKLTSNLGIHGAGYNEGRRGLVAFGKTVRNFRDRANG